MTSHVITKYPYIISDACDEEGKGQFEVRVTQVQLDALLAAEWIYEDNVSEYVEENGRLHFHPNHEKVSFMQIADLIYYWPGSGIIRPADHISGKA